MWKICRGPFIKFSFYSTGLWTLPSLIVIFQMFSQLLTCMFLSHLVPSFCMKCKRYVFSTEWYLLVSTSEYFNPCPWLSVTQLNSLVTLISHEHTKPVDNFHFSFHLPPLRWQSAFLCRSLNRLQLNSTSIFLILITFLMSWFFPSQHYCGTHPQNSHTLWSNRTQIN